MTADLKIIQREQNPAYSSFPFFCKRLCKYRVRKVIMRAVFLDTETSGLDPFVHRPLEIACVIVDLYTGERIFSYETLLNVILKEKENVDPKSLSYTGITKNDLLTGVFLEKAAADLERIFFQNEIVRDKAVFICQNPSFDRPFFSQIISVARQEELLFPYHWLDLASMYWAKILMKKNEFPHTCTLSKDAIAAQYGLPKESMPHRAKNGVEHLLLCYEKVVGFPGSIS